MKRTFEELMKVGEKYHRDTNFCTIIATATVCEMSFSKAYYKMKQQGRRDRRGAYQPQYFNVIKARGFDIKRFSFNSCTVHKVLKQLPSKGTFLINVSRHVIAVVDGVINDWSDEAYHKNHKGKPCYRRVVEINEIIKSTKPKGRVL
jgi:hypothetical protein